MNTTTVLLLLVVFLPLLFAVLVPLFGRAARRVPLWLALSISAITIGARLPCSACTEFSRGN